MAVDPAVIEETRAWLKKASNDLRSAKHALTSDPPLTDTSVFHAEQAAEKALKAFLTFHRVVFRKTHSIEEIGKQCEEIDPSLQEIVDQAVPLTEYATVFRYPGDPDEASLRESNEAVEVAESVCNAILKKLPKEMHPNGSATT